MNDFNEQIDTPAHRDMKDAFRYTKFDMDKIDNLIEALREGWEDGREEIEANGKTVRENEAEAKAEVLADLKDYATWANVINWVAVTYLTKRAMDNAGVQSRWKRAAIYLIVSEIRTYAMDPARYTELTKSHLARIRKGMSRG